jgi:5'-3' exonuclease
MVLLIDADSLIFASCYRTKDEENDDPYYRDIKDSISKFDEQYMKIVNDLEDQYEIDKVITFNGSKGNFRKLITPVYKANRKKQELPPLLHDMHQYVKDTYNSIFGYGIETDDLVARYWYNISNDTGRDNVMIVSIDKDYKQFPCLMYNYHFKHKVILDITKEEALYNFYEQMIMGDTADNVNYFKGKGKSLQKIIIKIAKQNTNTLKNYTYYLKNNTKAKQDRNTRNVITF